jgi:phosphate transport system protein
MERHFEQDLDKLNKRILKMGNLVATQVHDALTALINNDITLAGEVVSRDQRIDKLDVKIDKLCQRIFALTQPVATDLRLIMSVLRMNNDLERMGDHAVSIAGKVGVMNDYHPLLVELHADELISMVDLIVRDVITILHTRNTAFVSDIFSLARTIEEKIQGTTTRLIACMMETNGVIPVATHMIILLTAMERLAAYSTNIAEAIVFLVEGKLVKHRMLLDDPDEAADDAEGVED